MRSVFLALSVLAIANVLGVLAFFGWLRATDRIDAARLQQVRDLLAPTRTEQQKKEAEEDTKAKEAEKARAEAERLSRPTITAEQELSARMEKTEVDRQRQQRLRDELAMLRRTVDERTAELTKLREQIAAAKAEFESITKKTREETTSQQFKKAMATLESMKPSQAMEMLRQVMTGPGGIDQTVAYLNAMEEGARSKVISEFAKDDPKVAADLLERLRTRGIPASPGAAPK